jgi:thioesterase domain-containing protein/acyl carrier protein
MHSSADAGTSICFDLSIFEFFYSLSVGKPIRIIENGLQLGKYLLGDRFVLINSVPVVIENLLKEGTDLSNVSVINMAGEPISLYVQQTLDTIGKEVRNLYGPTEDTTYSTIFRLTDNAPVLIGKPISNTVIYIINEIHELLPIGVIGEICIGGAGLARGYLNRPELTSQKFFKDPFKDNEDDRIYRTGDLGRWLADGNIEYLGRIDHQVKIRGYRIELGEIESVLCQHPQIQQSVVIVHDDPPGNKRLIAYIISNNKKIAVSDIRQYITTKLPEYMVPALFVFLKEFPLTLNGKLDRSSLPIPDGERTGNEKNYVSPGNDIEVTLKKIWEECLEINSIGVEDNFFEIGGNSIQAAQMFSKIRKALGKQLPLAILFKASTIRQLAIYIKEDGGVSLFSSLVAIQPNGSKTPLFCIHAGAGTVLLYRSLSEHLGLDQPVYGLQAKGLNATEPPHTTIEEMAFHYNKEIRSIQPKGPYLLAGYCFGCTVAFEMAQQLIRQNEKVGLVISFNGDYIGPGERPIFKKELNSENNISKSFFSNVSTYGKRFMDINQRIARKVIRLLSSNDYQKYILRKALYKYYILLKRPLPESLGRQYFRETHEIIAKAYRPKPYPGKMVIFRSANIFSDPCLGWDPFVTDGIETCDIPGEHKKYREIIREPYVQQTAEKLSDYLKMYDKK